MTTPTPTRRMRPAGGGRHDPTYHLAVSRLPEKRRSAVHALYGFVRGADEIVDGAGPDLRPNERRAALDEWQGELERGLETGGSDHPVIAALVHATDEQRLPVDELRPYMASMRMDCGRLRSPDPRGARALHGRQRSLGRPSHGRHPRSTGGERASRAPRRRLPADELLARPARGLPARSDLPSWPTSANGTASARRPRLAASPALQESSLHRGPPLTRCSPRRRRRCSRRSRRRGAGSVARAVYTRRPRSNRAEQLDVLGRPTDALSTSCGLRTPGEPAAGAAVRRRAGPTSSSAARASPA